VQADPRENRGAQSAAGPLPKMATGAPFELAVEWGRMSRVRPAGSACTRYLRVFTLGTDECSRPLGGEKRIESRPAMWPASFVGPSLALQLSQLPTRRFPMPDSRHLKNAPIREALIDIRVKANPQFDVATFSQLKSLLHDEFPEVEERHSDKFSFHLKPKADPSTMVEHLGLQGYFFKSDAQKLVAQFRIDGFTLNKLHPYTDWDDLFPLALDLWRHYSSIAKPQAVTRQALRYINHIHIGADIVDLDEYLAAAPQVPVRLPQAITAFLYRVTILNSEEGIAAHVVQALAPKPQEQGTTIILDIDAHKEVDISPLEEDPLVANFQQLRRFKNLVFFNYLTVKALELFE